MENWIYCDEENPKKSDNYIVTAILNHDNEPTVRVFYYEKEPHWGGNPVWMEPAEGNGGWFTTLAKVIAWKPCPKAAEVKK